MLHCSMEQGARRLAFFGREDSRIHGLSEVHKIDAEAEYFTVNFPPDARGNEGLTISKSRRRVEHIMNRHFESSRFVAEARKGRAAGGTRLQAITPLSCRSRCR